MMPDIVTPGMSGSLTQGMAPIAGQSASAGLKPGYKPDLDKYRRWLSAFETNKRDELNENALHRKYYHDKQWTAAELRKLKRRNQPVVTDNGIKRKIDFLVGVEQRMRRDPKGYPRRPDSDDDANVATQCIRFACEQNDWEGVSSDGMHNGLVSGIGVAFVGVRTNARGVRDVDLRRVDPARFVYDTRSINPDFSDARWMGIDIWQDIDEASEGLDEDKKKALRALCDKSNTIGSTASSKPVDTDQATQWGDFEHKRVRVCEIYALTVAPPYNVAKWHYCKFSGDVVIKSMLSPYQNEDGEACNPYVAWSPYVDEEGNRYGPIRSMRPLQDEINHRRSKFLHELNNRQTFSNRPGAVSDVDALKEEMAKADGHMEYAGGEWGKDVGIVDRTAQLKGHFDLLMESQARLENYGPNPGMIGKGPGVADASGRALLAQRDSGMTELSPVFERHRAWKLRVFRAVWYRIRQAWNNERFVTVTDDPNAVRFVGINQYQMVRDPTTGALTIQAKNVVAQIDVDIILDEGPDTVVMQEELLQTISQMGPMATTPMGLLIIELSNVPDKERLKKMLTDATAPTPQQQATEARIAALEEREKAATIDEKDAKAQHQRVDSLVKLVGASKPTAAPADEFGIPTGPPPPTLDMGLVQQLITMLQAFPLQYGQPTVSQQIEQAEPPAPNGPPGGEAGDTGVPPPPDASGPAMNGAGPPMQQAQPMGPQ
jgi:hypothetical protein